MFKNRVLRKIFRPKSDEVTGEWRRLQNEELYGLYPSPNIIRVTKSRRMRRAGHVACMRDRRGVYRILVRRPEGRRPLGRPRRRWDDNIKMHLQDVERWGIDWIALALFNTTCVNELEGRRWMRLAEFVARMRLVRNTCKILGRKHEGTRPPDSPSHAKMIILKSILNK